MENDVYRARPRKKKKTKWIPLALLFSAYIFRQAYLMNANSVDTVKAGEGYINDSIISQGIICREEVVLNYSGTGVIDYLAEDGERISKGHLIASVYPSEGDIERLVFLRNRQDMLDDLQHASDSINNTTLDMSVTRKQLSQQLSRLSRFTETADYAQMNNNLTELTLSLNKIGVATGRITDFTTAKSQIEGEISAVKAAINQPVDKLYSSYTGYFLQKADGYENCATTESFIAMDYKSGADIINGNSNFTSSGNEYGKIITDYKWDLCTYVDKNQADDLKVGSTLKISVNAGDNVFHKATVKNVIDKGDKTLVVLQCSDMNSEAAVQRIINCEILFKQYKGIKIPKSALHFDGEQMGVFVNFSNLVKFKKITPVYEDDNYVIVPVQNSENNQVKLHDSIIVKGRNLYDGKYL